MNELCLNPSATVDEISRFCNSTLSVVLHYRRNIFARYLVEDSERFDVTMYCSNVIARNDLRMLKRRIICFPVENVISSQSYVYLSVRKIDFLKIVHSSRIF